MGKQMIIVLICLFSLFAAPTTCVASPSKEDENEEALLHRLIGRGEDTDVVRMYLDFLRKEGHRLDSRNQEDLTPLHIAVKKKHVPLVRLLLEYGVDVNVQDDQGNTPLHLAFENGFFYMVFVLLEYGADVNLTNKAGDTSLHCALLQGAKIDTVKELCLSGANVYKQSEGNLLTPVQLASLREDEEIIAYFRKHYGAFPELEKIDDVSFDTAGILLNWLAVSDRL